MKKKIHFEPAWAFIVFFSIILWILGIKGVCSKNYANEIYPVIYNIERENVSKEAWTYELNGQVWIIFQDERIPVEQIASGPVTLKDGSKLIHREDGELIHETESIVIDKKLVKAQKKAVAHHMLYVVGGICTLILALTLTVIAVLVAISWIEDLLEYWREKKKAGRSP